MAGAIDVAQSDLQENMDNYFRIMFYEVQFDYDSEAGEATDGKIIWHDAAYCRDIYSLEHGELYPDYAYNLTEFYDFEFTKSGRNWICPDTDEITLLNDPENFKQGREFVMVVNTCSIAEELYNKEDVEVKSYSVDADGNQVFNCDDSISADDIDKFNILTKLMSQSFNPYTYTSHDDKLDYSMYYR